MKKNYILVMAVLIIVTILSATFAALHGNNGAETEAVRTTLELSGSTNTPFEILPGSITNCDDIGDSFNKHTESEYDQWKPGDPITKEIIEEVMNKPVNDLSLRDYQILYEWQKSWQNQYDDTFDSTLTIDGASTVYEFTKNAKEYFEDPSSGIDIIVKPSNPNVDIGIVDLNQYIELNDPKEYYIIDISSVKRADPNQYIDLNYPNEYYIMDISSD